MYYIIAALLILIGFKVTLTWFVAKIGSLPKTKLYAEDIIKAGAVKAGPIPIGIEPTYPPEVKEYSMIRNNFKRLLKSRKLTRADLKAIKKFLEENVPCYEVKRFKNEAHAIYSMLKWAELEQLLEVNKFLNTLEEKVWTK